MNETPSKSYGILRQETPTTIIEEAVEQISNVGYALLESGYSAKELQSFSQSFDETHQRYRKKYGANDLERLNELNTIRAPLTIETQFLDLALNAKLLELVEKLIPGKFILNQQNGIINPPQDSYNQDAWHRDLPYQHFVSSQALAINALFCVDDFSCENGATFVLPASHKLEPLPSKAYIENNAMQIEAKAGTFIVLDCMLFHAGGRNRTNKPRRAVNHVFNIPYFKQQINIPNNLPSANLSEKARDILGFNFMEPASVSEYLLQRSEKLK
jgi:ectoine hydroxylase-related dioxygenase (phytanoyl-CoA dioxygenase family)